MSCERCELPFELYERSPQTDRDYWVMTELFVFLHGGSDVCRIEGRSDDQTAN